MPAGILSLSSYLKKELPGVNVSLLDLAALSCNAQRYNSLNQFLRIETRKNISFHPDIICISINFSAAHALCMAAVDVFKKIWPTTPVAVGGAHATNTTRFLLEKTKVDLVFRGEGEIALAELVKNLDDPDAPLPKGAYSKEHLSDELALCEMPDVCTLPFPDWDLLDVEAYTGNQLGWKSWVVKTPPKRVATVVTSRGCPNLCTYCSSHTVHGRKVRLRPIDSIVEEFRTLHERYGVELFIPIDDLFTASRKRTLEMIEKIRNLNIPNFEMQFPNALNINLLDETILDALIDAGASVLNFAIESGCPRTLEKCMKKRVDLDKARKFVTHCRKRGVVSVCYCVMGFPDESREDLDVSVNYFKSLDTDWVEFSIANPLVGSDLEKQCVDQGLMERNNEDIWLLDFATERPCRIGPMTGKEIFEYAERQRYEFNYVNNPNFAWGNYERAYNIFSYQASRAPDNIFTHFALAKACIGLGKNEEATRAFTQMWKLIGSNPESLKQFTTYGDLLPEEVRNLYTGMGPTVGTGAVPVPSQVERPPEMTI